MQTIGDDGTLRSKRNEFDRDDIGEAEYRRARYVDGAPVLKLVLGVVSVTYSGAASAARRLRLQDADNARWDGVALGDQTPGPARHNTQIFGAVGVSRSTMRSPLAAREYPQRELAPGGTVPPPRSSTATRPAEQPS